ncbi:MAG: 3-phosphoshikimate 1-carboxyvinyltransferase [Rhodospirillales bacterium]|nr:3-phosphoshikimate 1-carboxyvinyltransferase [Rhodospirillales bacterium]
MVSLTTPLISRPTKGLSGDVRIPGDKSVSHRALMLGAMAVGETRIHGLLEAGDVIATADAMKALGASVERDGGGVWQVRGRGVGGLREPDGILDMGNSGTGARLLMGILATHPFTSFMTGDASLCKRPMRRVTGPLEGFGAAFRTRSEGRLPLAVCGTGNPVPVDFRSPVASAQVKSAVLLAGLNAPGTTRVIEERPTRDHTERMLGHFGAQISVEDVAGGGKTVSLCGQPELSACEIVVPGDISSAAFPLVAALISEGSAVTVRNVGLNALRDGLLVSLREMGAEIHVSNRRVQAGEPVGDIEVTTSQMNGIDVPPERAPSMIDEYPILAVAAACARGTTRLHGLAELRVKESDRLAGMAGGLAACGVDVEIDGDSLIIKGGGRPPKGGATISVNMDHRIAMAFLVLGMATKERICVDDGAPIATSFPEFIDLMNALGAKISQEEGRK